MYFKEGIDESTEPFAKNVKLEAHTEYTSHVNGKIGEGGDDSGVIILTVNANQHGFDGATFEEAKNAFLSNKKVLLELPGGGDLVYYLPCAEYIEDYEGQEALRWQPDGNIIWLADGTVVAG